MIYLRMQDIVVYYSLGDGTCRGEEVKESQYTPVILLVYIPIKLWIE